MAHNRTANMIERTEVSINEIPAPVIKTCVGQFLNTPDTKNFALVSRRYCGIFQPSARASRLVSHILKNEVDEALQMLSDMPQLMVETVRVKDYSGRMIVASAFGAAVGSGNFLLYKKIENLFVNDNAMQAVLLKQFNQQFPVSPHETIQEDFEAIDKVTAAIRENNEVETALEAFRNHFNARMITSGWHFNLLLLHKAYEIFYSRQPTFEGIQSSVFWRQVLGYIQRLLPPWIPDLFPTLLHMSKCGKLVLPLSADSLAFSEEEWKILRLQKKCTDTQNLEEIFPLDRNPTYRLGFQYAIDINSTGMMGLPCRGSAAPSQYENNALLAFVMALHELIQSEHEALKMRLETPRQTLSPSQ